MAHFTLTSNYKLNSGYEIPILGFGTAASASENFKLKHEESLAACTYALGAGYRHFDTARMYDSEKSLGEAIRQSGLQRCDLFVTSKVCQSGYKETTEAINASLRALKLDYIDLYLNHSPYGGRTARKGTWRALVEAQKEGKIRSIGVSNYGVHHLNETEAYIKELEAELGRGNAGEISVGQWDLHPWLSHPDITEWCKQRGIVVEAYCPLVKGQRFDEPSLQMLMKKHNKSGAQILLRWSLQKGFIPLPKSVTPSRIQSNASIFDFELTDDDMTTLETGDYAPTTWDPTVSPLDN